MPRHSTLELPKICRLLALGLLAAGHAFLGCSSPAEQAAQAPGTSNAGTSATAGADNTGNAGAAGTAGASGGSAGSANAGSESGGSAGQLTGGAGGMGGEQAAAGAAGAAMDCALAPVPQVTAGTSQQFDILLTFDGTPFQRGDVVTIDDREITLNTFLFFVSQATLLQGTEEVPVDLVLPDSNIEPYGVHLFDLETTDSYSFRINAPQGSYDGLKLAVGLAPACNGGNPADRLAPLNSSSPMNWTWGFGYMFLRLEGTHTGPADLAPVPMQVHGGAIGAMGTGEAFLSIPGAFAVGAVAVPLQLDLRPILELAATQGDHLAGGRVMLDALPTLNFITLPTP